MRTGEPYKVWQITLNFYSPYDENTDLYDEVLTYLDECVKERDLTGFDFKKVKI